MDNLKTIKCSLSQIWKYSTSDRLALLLTETGLWCIREKTEQDICRQKD